MDPDSRTAIGSQFGAALDMLDRALEACPEDSWGGQDPRAFWYLAYHTLFYVEYYLADQPEGFTPLPPYGLEELDPAGVLPPRIYTKAELRAYLEHCRRRCRERLATLTPEAPARPSATRPELSAVELLIYNLRHVQHHAAQLQWLLRNAGLEPPRWVSRGTGMGGA